MSKNSVVGFFIQNPFHYFLYESVIDNLVKKNVKCHLVINDCLKNDNEWGEMYNGLINFIESIEREDIDVFLYSTIDTENYTYDCLISAYYTPYLEKIGKYHIRLMYSLAKEDWTYSWWNVFYNKILCYGNYDYKKLNIYNNCEIIGNPKFDKWFNNELPNCEKIKKQNNLVLDDNKKTILYVPTYGELSSIDYWYEEIVNISNEFNIILKLHHGTAYLQSETMRRKYLVKYFNNVLADTVDLLELLKISDYVISDNSGVIYDAILAEKNILLLNTNYNSYASETIEAKIRDKITNIDLGSSIVEKLKDENLWINQKKIRSELKNTFFLYRDGLAGKRAAAEIINLLDHIEELDNHFLLSLRKEIFK